MADIAVRWARAWHGRIHRVVSCSGEPFHGSVLYRFACSTSDVDEGVTWPAGEPRCEVCYPCVVREAEATDARPQGGNDHTLTALDAAEEHLDCGVLSPAHEAALRQDIKAARAEITRLRAVETGQDSPRWYTQMRGLAQVLHVSTLPEVPAAVDRLIAVVKAAEYAVAEPRWHTVTPGVVVVCVPRAEFDALRAALAAHACPDCGPKEGT